MVTSFLRSRFNRYLLGPGLLALGAILFETGPWWTGCAAIVIGWADVGITTWYLDSVLERETGETAIRATLRQVVDQISAGTTTMRANLMLYDAPRNGWRIAYAQGAYARDEMNLIWVRGQGCVGRAIETERTTLAPEDVELPVSVADIDRRDRTWGMSDEQIRATAEKIGAVLSVPCFDASGSMIAIFNLDDSAKLADSELGKVSSASAAEIVAKTAFPDFLAKTGRDFPDDTR